MTIKDLESQFSKHIGANPYFKLIGEQADLLGLKTYVIGGYVRDLVLNRQNKDADFVTIGNCFPLAEAVAKALGPNVDIATYKTYGTAMVKHGDWILEFVSARKESYSTDSRNPQVEPGTLEEDQLRRDFTINAMAIGLNRSNFGEWLDPFGGLEHLHQKTIKTPLEPSSTFSDDPLRMMRAIRFASQLEFDIEADTFEAIQKMKERISIISAERVADELNKIVLSNPPSYGFKLLYYSGLLQLILPEMVALAGVENKEGKTHKDNFFHTLEVLDNVAAQSNDLWLRWAAILHDIAKPLTKWFSKTDGWTFHGHEEKGARMVPKLFARLKLPLNEHMRFVEKLVRLHLRPISLTNDAVTDSAVRRLMFEAGDALHDLMLLCRADVTTKNPNRAKRYLANFDKVEEKMADVEESDRLRQFQAVLTGDQIMNIFNLKPSKEIGVMKEALREALLEGTIKNTMAECLFLAIVEAEKLNLKPREGFDPEAFLVSTEQEI